MAALSPAASAPSAPSATSLPIPAAVIVFPGSNGDRDLFEALQQTGFAPRYVRDSEELPADVALVGLPGGFSYGDYWRAGMLASRARAMRGLHAVHARGGLILGICNGFQILTSAGLLPGALTHNSPPRFQHRWLSVGVTAAAAGSPWFAGLAAGTSLTLPIAHAEGAYRFPHVETAATLPVEPAIPLCYAQNPNGSQGDAAAVLDASGRILGIMPHPERAIDATLGSTDGRRLFVAARDFLRAQAGRKVPAEVRP
ncbi:MAG TPA: phosphoribosylformylglycinamidine synthase subunit PurQ [Pseudomonadota bacterium]|nr:phosphoribosylformylglycinamidine synthase subunit PurQ [Pseudomonadota bacterium]